MIRAADEGPHTSPSAWAPERRAAWCETWSFDFADDHGVGGFVRLVQFPGRGIAWYWAYLVVPDFGLLVVRDHEVPLVPRPNPLEVRAEALWAELICEQPFEHWSIAAEAFGLRVEAPGDAERGERVAVGLDLGWEALTATHDPGMPKPGMPKPGMPETGTGYSQVGTVVGALLVGADRLPFDGRATLVGRCSPSAATDGFPGHGCHRAGPGFTADARAGLVSRC